MLAASGGDADIRLWDLGEILKSRAEPGVRAAPKLQHGGRPTVPFTRTANGN
jgi:hypothetical protein